MPSLRRNRQGADMTAAAAARPPEPEPDPGAILLRLRCPEHRRNRRGGKGGWRQGTALYCEKCRTLWAAGHGPDIDRREPPGDHGPAEPWDASPPI